MEQNLARLGKSFSEEILKELEKKLTELAILKIHPPVIKKHTKEG